ncbi:hypothetical protein SBC2_08740 [Caballeronia sp. SBC2]|nr:hypothetical protein SBC2_08740 [Caballeronia sp. SBC2]
MPVWQTARVEAEPEIILVRWRVLQTDCGDRHLVGARRDDFNGRVSSAIVELDVSRSVVVTRSGRIYQLEGAPGYNADAQYVWDNWCVVNGVTSYEDVTSSVYPNAS